MIKFKNFKTEDCRWAINGGGDNNVTMTVTFTDTDTGCWFTYDPKKKEISDFVRINTAACAEDLMNPATYTAEAEKVAADRKRCEEIAAAILQYVPSERAAGKSGKRAKKKAVKKAEKTAGKAGKSRWKETHTVHIAAHERVRDGKTYKVREHFRTYRA